MLAKSRRLDRQSFFQVKSSGRTFRHQDFSLIVAPGNLLPLSLPRYAVVISSHLSKSAVVRNSLKRRIFSSLGSLNPKYHLIFYPRAGMLNLTRAEIDLKIHPFISEISFS